jgi:predicted lipid-binding transport protein (Tim44 family)
MRDIGILVWVALLIVGVVGSMVSRIRGLRQMQSQRVQAPQRTQPPPPARPQPFVVRAPQPAAPVAGPAPVRRPAPAPQQVAPETVGAAPAARKTPRRLFSDRGDLVRAVIASEVLGKPRAFDDE